MKRNALLITIYAKSSTDCELRTASYPSMRVHLTAKTYLNLNVKIDSNNGFLQIKRGLTKPHLNIMHIFYNK